MATYPVGGIQVTSYIALTNSADTYATHVDILGWGGHMSVDTITDRNNIPAARRKFGMTVTVTADITETNNKTYQLKNEVLGGVDDVITNNFNWIEFASGGEGNFWLTEGTTTLTDSVTIESSESLTFDIGGVTTFQNTSGNGEFDFLVKSPTNLTYLSIGLDSISLRGGDSGDSFILLRTQTGVDEVSITTDRVVVNVDSYSTLTIGNNTTWSIDGSFSMTTTDDIIFNTGDEDFRVTSSYVRVLAPDINLEANGVINITASDTAPLHLSGGGGVDISGPFVQLNGEIELVTSTGYLLIDGITNTTTDYVLYFDESTGIVSYGAAPGGGGGGGLTDGDKGDITVSSSGTVWTIDNNTITLAKMADMATASFIGRTTASTGDPEVLSATQATAILNTFTSSLKGLVPASGGGTTSFLRADGNWSTIGYLQQKTETGSTYTVTSSDNGYIIYFTNACTITLNTTPNTSTEVTLVKAGTGDLILATGGGSSISTVSGALTIEVQYGAATFVKNSSTAWFGWGALGAAANTLTDGDKGDIVVSSSGSVWTIDNEAVSYAKIQQVSNGTRFLGRSSGTGGVIQEISPTSATAMLNTFTTSLKGLVPSGGSSSTYLRGDGTWVTLPTDGDKGDITVSSSGATWTIDNNAVTLAKLQDITTSSFIGRTTASTGDPEVLTGTQATTLLDVFTSSLKGLVPASGGGTSNFLRADGTWASTSGITLTGSSNELLKYSSSTAAVGTKVFSASNGNLTLGDSSNSSVTIAAREGVSGSNNGASLYLSGGEAYSTSGNGTGGSIFITAGQKRTAGSGTDGNITITGKNVTISSTFDGLLYGTISLSTASLSLGDLGGAFFFMTAASGSSSVNIGTTLSIGAGAGYSGSNGNGGHLHFSTGTPAGSGTAGSILFQSKSGSYYFGRDINNTDQAQNTTFYTAAGISGSENGKNFSVIAGNGYTVSGNGNGGSITLQTGQRNTSGSGTDGNITLDTRNGYLIITSIPTSSAGLPSGAIWSNSGVLTRV